MNGRGDRSRRRAPFVRVDRTVSALAGTDRRNHGRDFYAGADRRLDSGSERRRRCRHRARPRHSFRGAALRTGNLAEGSRTSARDARRGRPHGRPGGSSSSSARPERCASATRFTRSTAGSAHSAHGHSPAGNVLGPRVAIGRVPERPRLRLHHVSARAPTASPPQRGVHLRGRRRADTGARRAGAVAAALPCRPTAKTYRS